ncbi:MAG: uroporphyrinogen decarboxylase family protein [Bacteroidales bacterium]|nr:uroporphyrinogen decarboxylase family protein [Bacteroidales bacterium]
MTCFKQTLECANPEGEVPFWELEFHLWEKYSGKKFNVGKEFTELTSKEKDIAMHKNSEVIAEICDMADFTAVTIPGNYWELAPGVPAYYWLPKKYRLKQAKILMGELGDHLTLITNTGGIMAMPGSENYTSFAVNMFDDPESIEKQAQKILEQGFSETDKFGNMGYEIFISASDLADNSGPFFPPEQFERFILPGLHKWSEYIKKQNGYSILHTDGNIEIYLEQIANTDLHALQSVDPVAGMDMMTTKKIVGDRLCLCGNLDCRTVITGPPHLVYEASIELLLAMQHVPGLIFGMSNVLEMNTPKENYDQVIRAVKKLGRINQARN